MRREGLVGLAVAVVLIAGIAGAATMTPTAHQTRVIAPVATPSPVPTRPAPTGRPTPLPRPRPTARPTRRPRPPAPVATPGPTRTVAAAGRPGPYAPLAIRVTLSPGSGTTRTAFVLRVRARDGDGQARIGSVTWGDGSSYREPVVAAMCPVPRPTPAIYQPSPSSLDETFGHAWRHAGRYRVVVDVTSGPPMCSQGSRATSEDQQAVFEVPITQQGPDISNGPALPALGALELHPSDQGPREAEFFLRAGDTDGWMLRFTVDWGDGTSQTLGMDDYRTCDDGNGSRYPGLQQQEALGASARHAYAKAGRYTVRVTVFSGGCSGSDLQRAGATGTVRV